MSLKNETNIVGEMLANLSFGADFNTTQATNGPTLSMKIFYIIMLFLVEIIGNILLACMIYYQKYGVAEMKKTVNSILFSVICFAMILHNIFIIPILLAYIISNPVSEL